MCLKIIASFLFGVGKKKNTCLGCLTPTAILMGRKFQSAEVRV